MKRSVLKTEGGLYLTRDFNLSTNAKIAWVFDSVNRAKNILDIIKDRIPFELFAKAEKA